MSGQTDLDLADAEPGASHDVLFEEYNFEQLFGIPPDHRLMLVRSRSRGGFARAVYWQHDEYDPAGRRIARYESCLEERQGLSVGRWRKQDPSGAVLEERTFLD